MTRIGRIQDVERGRPTVRPKGWPGALRVLSVVAALLLIAAACGDDDDASDAPAEPEQTAAPAAPDEAEPSATEPAPDDAAEEMAEPETLKIGLMTGLSGGFAPWGTQFHDSLNLWAEMVNDGRLSQWSSVVSPDGGISVGGAEYVVEIVPYDTMNDVATAVAGAQKLVLRDNVSVIIGPVGETEAMVASNDVINDNGVLNLQLSTLWQSQGEQWPLSINILTDMQDYYQAVYQWMVDEHPEIERVAIITTDQPYGRIGALVAHKYAAETGAFEVVYESYVPFDTADYSAVVTAALAEDPDIIDIGGAASPNAFTGILTNAFQQGFQGTPPADGGPAVKFMATSWNPDLVLANVTEEYFEGVVQGYPTASWGPDGPTEEAAWLYNAMVDRYGDDQAAAWNTVTPGGYYAGRVLLEGIAAAGSVDPTAVAEALVNLEVVDTPMGEAGWTGLTLSGVDHSLVFPERVLQRQNAGWEIVAEIGAPFPWNYDWEGLPGADQFQPNP